MGSSPPRAVQGHDDDLIIIDPKEPKMTVNMSMPILVVDDYRTMIRIVQSFLTQLGFTNLSEAYDGSEAYKKMTIATPGYGLVISDWNMEPMSGFDLLCKVRADPALAKTPFILVTAESKRENVIAAKEAGVNNYIVKPFNAAALQLKLAAVLGGF
jgi:two-component system chemotaxis response regulator CheY